MKALCIVLLSLGVFLGFIILAEEEMQTIGINIP